MRKVVCEGLEFATQLSYSVLKVESDSTTLVSWIHFGGSVLWDYTYSLHPVCTLTSSSLILVRHVLHEATSAANFLANWACTHRISRYFLCSRDLSSSLFDILCLDAQIVPHARC